MRSLLYHRVSTTDQHPDAAREALRQAAHFRAWPVAQEIEETGSGALNDRPGLLEVMAAVRKRRIDVVVVWKLDRFGRSALDILANVQVLRQHGVQLLCCTQGLLISDQSDPMTSCMLQVMAAFAELERANIRERTLLGMRAARARGVHCGRPAVALPDLADVIKLKGEGMGEERIAAQLNTSAWAVRKVFKPVKRGTP